MKTLFRIPCVLAVIGLASLGWSDDTARSVSGIGTYAFLGAGLGLPLLRDGALGKERAWRTLDALGSSLVVSEGLKQLIRAPRPDGSGHDSFPSGHATLAFTVATMEAQFHPREAVFWYAGAAWIGQSRIALRKHNLLDVLGGAGLGYGIARLELGMPHGLILRPLIGQDGVGFALSGRF